MDVSGPPHPGPEKARTRSRPGPPAPAPRTDGLRMRAPGPAPEKTRDPDLSQKERAHGSESSSDATERANGGGDRRRQGTAESEAKPQPAPATQRAARSPGRDAESRSKHHPTPARRRNRRQALRRTEKPGAVSQSQTPRTEARPCERCAADHGETRPETTAPRHSGRARRVFEPWTPGAARRTAALRGRRRATANPDARPDAAPRPTAADRSPEALRAAKGRRKGGDSAANRKAAGKGGPATDAALPLSPDYCRGLRFRASNLSAPQCESSSTARGGAGLSQAPRRGRTGSQSRDPAPVAEARAAAALGGRQERAGPSARTFVPGPDPTPGAERFFRSRTRSASRYSACPGGGGGRARTADCGHSRGP